MRQAGRAHWITIAGIVGVLALVILVLFKRESPTTVANRFLIALAKGNVDDLVELSYYTGDRAKLREQWTYATQVAGPYYSFRWTVVTAKEADENTASVKTFFERNYGYGSYPENLDIPLLKKDGKWLVDVRSLYRGMYPAMPR